MAKLPKTHPKVTVTSKPQPEPLKSTLTVLVSPAKETPKATFAVSGRPENAKYWLDRLRRQIAETRGKEEA